MPRYLINLTEEDATRLERMCGGPVSVVPGHDGAVLASVDAVSDEEAQPIRVRLGISGPLYHCGGPEGGP